MKYKLVLAGITALLLSFSGVQAQDPDDGEEAESTIRLMGEAEAELPDAVTKVISLPSADAEDSAAVKAAAKNLKGLEKANERLQRRENGLSKADDARDRGAEMANEARDSRENRGRSEDHPDPPKPPGPPDK